jgi:aspartate aminotransferase-like enzyme
VLSVPWGEVADPQQVREALSRGDFDAVSLVHSETSTGALNPVAEIAAVAREFPGVRVLVDSVTGVGGTPMEFDAWGLDLALTGSQKALAMPPGLAFGVISEALLERAVALSGRGYYLDFERLYRQLDKGQVPTTPAITLMYAAAMQLRRIADEGLGERFERHCFMAARCYEWVAETRDRTGLELGVLAREGHRSPTVTCITLPDGMYGPDVVAAVRKRGWVIGSGYGRVKDSTIRIGHMGDHTREGLEQVLEVVGEGLVEVAGR